jgi:hypothetical protein
MNYDQLLLQCLQEECAELIKNASKINRFGSNDYYPGREHEGSNEEKFIAEAHDLLAVLDMINKRHGLGIGEGQKAEEAIATKQAKVLEFAHYSKRTGLVIGPIPTKPFE